MSVSPVRLNHAVLFVADLDRSLRFYTEVFGMEVVTVEPRMSAAFSVCPARGTTTTSGSSVSAPVRHDSAASGSTTWPGSSTRSTSSRQRASRPAGRRRVRRRVEPRQRRRASTVATPTGTSSNDDGCSRAASGVRTRTRRRSTRSTWPARVQRWTGVRTAGQVVVAAEGAER